MRGRGRTTGGFGCALCAACRTTRAGGLGCAPDGRQLRARARRPRVPMPAASGMVSCGPRPAASGSRGWLRVAWVRTGDFGCALLVASGVRVLHCERPRVYGCRPGLLRVTDGFGRARLAMGRKFAASWQVLTENGKWKAANRDIEGKAILERCVLPDRSHSIFRYAERTSGRLPISGKTCHIRAL